MSRSRRSHYRGMVSLSFGAVLAILVVSTVLLLNSQTVLTLTMTNRLELAEQAQLQLDSVLAMAKAHLAENRDFGKNGEVILLGKKDPSHPNDGMWAEISFAPGSPFSSINNLGGQSQLFGYKGVILDSGMCQLVAVSQYRNKRIIAYEMVTGPPLPFSLASSGAVVAGGNSVIGAVESAAVLADGLDRGTELIEGGVVANGAPGSNLPAGVSKTLTLRDQVEVVGVAQTAGSYEAAPTVNLSRGEIKQASEQEELPKLSHADYDPLSKGWEHQSHTESVVSDGKPLYGFHRFESDTGEVRFDSDLELNGALVYVKGNVTLTKPLKGTGALVASGKVTILGGADIKADSLAAIVAGGDLTVTGSRNGGDITSKFTGLLYTDGNLTLTDTRTVGAALAAGTGEVGSLMTIQDADVIASPEGQKVEIVIQDFESGGGGGVGGFDSGESGDDDAIIEPRAADLFVDGKFQTDRDFIESLMKILYKEVIYNSIEELPADVPSSVKLSLRSDLGDVADAWVEKAKEFRTQHEKKPVQIVKFDLNEFLNVSERLRSSQTFYIEG